MIRRVVYYTWTGRRPILRKFNVHELEYPEPRRARRIRDKQRMKARARWVAKHIWDYPDDHLDRAERIADHIKVCSCMGCGNQRRSEGLTIQERKAKESHE